MRSSSSSDGNQLLDLSQLHATTISVANMSNHESMSDLPASSNTSSVRFVLR